MPGASLVPPPWIAELPKDERGFYAPAEVGWREGKPVLSSYSIDRTLVLLFNNACAVCGYPMPEEDRNVYRAFAQSDAAHVRMYERDHTHDSAGPLHESCILYSGLACPYLREKSSRLHKGSKINPGGKRGTRAAVMGFKGYGVMFYAGKPHPQGEPSPMVEYLELDEDIPYRDGAELLERFHAAVERDKTLIDMSAPRLYWTDAPNEERDVKARRGAGTSALRCGDPDETLIIIGNLPYERYLLRS